MEESASGISPDPTVHTTQPGPVTVAQLQQLSQQHPTDSSYHPSGMGTGTLEGVAQRSGAGASKPEARSMLQPPYSHEPQQPETSTTTTTSGASAPRSGIAGVGELPAGKDDQLPAHNSLELQQLQHLAREAVSCGPQEGEDVTLPSGMQCRRFNAPDRMIVDVSAMSPPMHLKDFYDEAMAVSGDIKVRGSYGSAAVKRDGVQLLIARLQLAGRFPARIILRHGNDIGAALAEHHPIPPFQHSLRGRRIAHRSRLEAQQGTFGYLAQFKWAALPVCLQQGPQLPQMQRDVQPVQLREAHGFEGVAAGAAMGAAADAEEDDAAEQGLGLQESADDAEGADVADVVMKSTSTKKKLDTTRICCAVVVVGQLWDAPANEIVVEVHGDCHHARHAWTAPQDVPKPIKEHIKGIACRAAGRGQVDPQRVGASLSAAFRSMDLGLQEHNTKQVLPSSKAFSEVEPPVAKLKLNLPGPYVNGTKPWFTEASDDLIAYLKKAAAELRAEMLNGREPHDCCDSGH